MKKILVISSSPRLNGNSDELCNQFMRGAQKSGNTVEKIRLNDFKINYCTGCGVCYNKKTLCPQRDDMEEILEKMIEADIIVMATPVYFYTMAAQMKTLIDRTCSRYTEINNKDFYFLITAADNNSMMLERTLEAFRGFTYCLDNAREKGVLLATGLWQIGDVINTKFIHQAYGMGINV